MLKLVNALKGKSIIAIDGVPASGKTTLASYLEKNLECNVVSIDDFYMPLEKRKSDAFEKGGNNVDYSRLIKEVIIKHLSKTQINFKKYNCVNNQYSKTYTLEYKPVLILEGTYSQKDLLNQYLDFRVLLTVDKSTQNSRLIKKQNYSDFVDLWIPLAEKYIKEERILELSNIVINNLDIE